MIAPSNCNRLFLRILWIAASFCLLPVSSARAQFVISEFLASNASGLRDEDGDLSDWIEIQNAGPSPASLGGWYLTDSAASPTRWQFPATNLAANARILVFASGKNRAVSGAPLHSLFRLNTSGGYLALVKPDGVTVASKYSYLKQFPDISCGMGLGNSSISESIIPQGATTKYRIPTASMSNWSIWFRTNYSETTSWKTGSYPAGYDFTTGAVTVAYGTPQNTAGNQVYGGALGMDFDVASPVLLTELGCFDDLSDGFTNGTSITVKLWKRDNNGTPDNPSDDTGIEILAAQTFTNTAAGTLTNGNRFHTLTAPITLTNGSYTIVAHGYNASERNGNAGGDFPAPAVNTGGAALRFVGRSRYGNNTTQFPATVDAMTAQYGAGTFKFQVLPNASFPVNLLAMRNTNATACFRTHFTPTNTLNFNSLILSVDYDDGFVAWLNGAEVARRNAPASLPWNASATNTASITENFDLTAFQSLIMPGVDNVLAIQGLNVSNSDIDFRIHPSLSGTRLSTNPAIVYFTSPTPGGNNTEGQYWPRVVINEIHSDPPNSKSVPAEFIELYNPLTMPVDVSGWAFTKGINYVFPAGTVISPKGYLILADSPATILSQFGKTALGPWTGSLDNDGETLELVDVTGAAVDTLSYSLGFPWPTVGDDPGLSMQLLNEGLDHDLGGSWRSHAPTPGAQYPLATTSVPPHVRQVSHSPKAPVSGTLVTLTAKVTDPNGVQAVNLEYQVVEPGNYIRLASAAYTNTWTAVSMHDDGLLGDAAAGDSVFTAQIPAGVQTHRRLIRYRVTTSDLNGNFLRVPYADDPSPNFAYFVYDGVPEWSGAVNPASNAPAVFGTNIMRKVRPFHLVGNATDVQNSQYNGAYDNGLYNFKGTVIVDDEVYDHVGYRIAGQNSTYETGKNKWKFKFNRGRWFEFKDDRGKALSAKRETIKFSGLTEPWAAWNRGLAGLDEGVAFRLYNLAGVAAPTPAFVQFRVIDDALESNPANQYAGDLWGLYIRFEEFDEQFKDEHGLPDGNLFLLQGGNNRLGAQGRGQPADFSDLNAFRSGTTGYNASSRPIEWWRTNVNLIGYYTWRAVTEAVNNTDIREGENVAYFRNPTNGLWSIHPWDSDLLYEQLDRWGPEGTQSQSQYEQIRRSLNNTNLMVEFQGRVRELQDLLLNHEQIAILVNEVLGYVTENGPVLPGFVEVDRRMWEWHPRAANKGIFYRTPYPIPNMGYGPPQPFYRTLQSADFVGMVAWVTNFIVSDPHGGARLAAMAVDNTIPATPTLAYLGPVNYPSDGLTFQTTDFSSPANRAFAALQWRLAEVAHPGITNFNPGDKYHYEIESLWDSGEITAFNNQITMPPAFVKEGHAYRVRVKHKDSEGRWSHWSEPVQFVAGTAGVSLITQSLIVSELMYDPPAFGGYSGDAYEFIELKNVGPATLDLSALTFTAGISFTFTNGTSLASGAKFLLVRDAVRFLAKYPATAINGIYTGKLDNNRETLTLAHPIGGTVWSFTYGNAAPWPVTPNAHGFSLVPVNDGGIFDMENGALWRASGVPGGSPGAVDAAPFIARIVINEVLAHTDLPQVDTIELFNPNPTNVNIGGWFISNDPTLPKKYRIPNGTTILANGYLAFDEGQFNVPALGTNAFRLDSHGEPLYLFSGDASTNLTGYSHGLVHEASANGVSFGRHINSAGEEQFPAQISLTPNAANSGPSIGPVVISEIMYHPAEGGEEFIELRSIASTNVPLYDLAHPTNAWKLNGIGYTFPTNLTMGPSQFLIVVPVDPAVFRAKYNLPGSVQIIGPYSGSLQDDGENLQLQRPDAPDITGVPYITVDAVRYNDRVPWPLEADGLGRALQRNAPAAYGNDPINWGAAPPTLGGDCLDALVPAITRHPAPLTLAGGATAVFTAAATGAETLAWQWRKNGINIPGATNTTLTFSNVARQHSGSYSAAVTNIAGMAVSDAAQLRVLVPQRLSGATLLQDGTVQILSRDADGGTPDVGDLAGFTAEISTNLVDWTALASALSITNGQLLLRDTNAVAFPHRFYRILEQ